MKKIIVLIAAFASLNAFAEKATFTVTKLQSPIVNGVLKLVIVPQVDGKLAVSYNPNTCSASGMCTKMATSYDLVEAKVVADRRPVDGSLILELTPEITLIVGSGNRVDGMISYTAEVNMMGKESFKLTPNVDLNLGNGLNVPY
jgi:hypothetical protein